MARHPHIVNEKDVTPMERTHGDRFALSGRPLGMTAGSQRLGCTRYTVPPGKTAFPAHVHHANEEAVYILSGTGLARMGEEKIPVGPGDYIALHAGGPAHQLLNTGAQLLEYLCFSTMISPEVVEYPDSKKVGAMVGTWKAPVLRELYRKGSGVDYYDGE